MMIERDTQSKIEPASYPFCNESKDSIFSRFYLSLVWISRGNIKFSQ